MGNYNGNYMFILSVFQRFSFWVCFCLKHARDAK